jgi:FOG: CheY-like receiver
MNAILGMAHLVERTELSDPQRVQVAKIHAAADTLLQLLNNILDYSKMEAGKMQVERIPFHMGRLLNSMRGSGTEKARAAGTRLVTSIPSTAPTLLIGDPARLGQALSILLEEAISHSQGFPVEIGCRTEDNNGRAATLHFTKTVQGARLDTETLEDLARCFSGQSAAVASLDSRELSLLLAGSIMRLMGGKAVAENLENGFLLAGIVRLDLPESAYEDQTLRFDGERVLLLGNQSGTPVAKVRKEFKDLLQRYNLRVEESDAIEDAVKSLREADRLGTPFAMVVADMPHNSSDALHYIERLKHGLAVSRPPLLVLTTGLDIRQLPPELLNSGIDAFLPRPINESMLVNTFSGLILDRGGSGDNPDSAENRPAEDLFLKGLSALLVEDNAVNREIAVELLENAGAAVHTAGNGIEAVKACGQSPLPFDMVLMDLEMPAMGGIEATRIVREQLGLTNWRLPIIAMTAHNSPDEVAACLEAGMNDHTLKPIVLSQFYATLRRWLPPDAEHCEPALRSLRKMRHILLRSHPRDAELLKLLDPLVPWLRQGRVDALRGMLEQQDGITALAMIDDFLAHPGVAQHGGKQD